VALALNVLGVCRPAAAQHPSAKDVNAANNPLTPSITFNVHDLWAPELYDLEPGSNSFLLRGVIPHKLGGRGQLFRYTLPIVKAPDGLGGTVTGPGDLSLFDLFPFLLKKARMELAVGPSPNGEFEVLFRFYGPEKSLFEKKAWRFTRYRESLRRCAVTTAQNRRETIDTRIGTLEFTHDFANGFPTDQTVQKLYDERDFQRACQAYLWALPAVSFTAWQRGINALGERNGQIVAILSYEALMPPHALSCRVCWCME